MQADWLIIGGGPHGVHLATRLLAEGVPASRLAILDPAASLLHRWRSRTQATRMKYLRSPSVHNVGVDPFDLIHFSKTYGRKAYGLFTIPYKRPSLKLFNEHCDAIIEQFGLDALHVPDCAIHITRKTDGFTVETKSGHQQTAQNLVLALGQHAAAWPDWAPQDHPKVGHIFCPDYHWSKLEKGAQIAIVGGGITAGQVALRFVRAGHKVHVISRHPIREHQFDSDPGWLGPKYLTAFHRERCFKRRRSLIKTARHRGSMPADVKRAIQTLKQRGDLHWHTAEVREFAEKQGELQLKLNQALSLRVDQVVLATGFQGARPGAAMVDELEEALQLPTAPCGYPIVDDNLRWGDGLFVMGALAELKLGPTARNIIGARHAADRIVNALHAEERAAAAAFQIEGM